MEQKEDHLIWLDLEMTGLDPEKQTILEIGTSITDSNLELIAEGPAIAIHHPKRILDNMDSWCIEHHGQSGLTQRCRESKISMAKAEQMTLDFLSRYTESGKSPLCGNSIGQDRRFLVKYMPDLNRFFHYRNVDVSTIKELARRWYPPASQAPPKKRAHHVLEDVRESIEELKHYRRVIFK
jgi:oligoribonuclease